MVHTTVNKGIGITDRWHTSSGGDKRGSGDNRYKDWLNDMRVGFYEEADYGVDWAGTGSGVDVETTFPVTPSDGVLFVRVNINAESGNLREYRYNGHTDTWDFTEFRGAISVTTTEEGLTATGPGTAIDYGSTAARTSHTMQIVGNANTGDINEVEVAFEGSLDGTNFFPMFSLFIKDLLEGLETVNNTIEMPMVKVRRNITLFDVVGDADVDVIITGV